MKTSVVALAVALSAFGAYGQDAKIDLTASSLCLQDQYNNKYQLTYDATHQYLYGTASMAQCSDSVEVTGSISYSIDPAAPGVVLELTPANATPVGCILTWKLKGTLPNFEWYYTSGYGGQYATWRSCSATPIKAPAGKGATR